MTDLLLPRGTRLLHIGPHKTGTTALQGALNLARPDLPALGALYPGDRRQHALAARAVTGNSGPRGDRPPTARDWDELVREVNQARDLRVIISSESFANATKNDAKKIVDALGGDSVHVLVTLRPLAKVMPSAWQQYVREGLKASYERWLKGMLLEEPYDRPTPSFWTRHAHDRLIELWTSVVGPERLTVVVVDSSDHSMLPRTVEDLVGLPAGTLKPEEGVANRSLTYGEIELVRALGQEFARRDWSDEMFRDLIRQGLIIRLQSKHQPLPFEGQIPTPTWALERVAEIGAEAADVIAGLGVHVVGDLNQLAEVPASTNDVFNDPPRLSVEAATEAVIGTIKAAHTKRRRSTVVVRPANQRRMSVAMDRLADKARAARRKSTRGQARRKPTTGG